jgi:type II secretory pathway pseudopilin PulG
MLAMMGIIAAFTVPSMLNSQNSNLASKQSAMAKDVAYMVFTAYRQYKLVNPTVPSNLKPSDLTPYLNYLSIDTSGKTIDCHPNWLTSLTCNATTPCIKLHNGGYLWLQDNYSFGGTSSLNAIGFLFDPDPNNNSTSTADGPRKAVQFILYYNGGIRTRGTVFSNSCNSGGCNGFGPDPTFDPSWFSGL